MEKKSKYEKLMLKEKSGWLLIKENEKREMEALGRDYLDFLSACKTERECVTYFSGQAGRSGFKELGDTAASASLKPGAKVMGVSRNKSIILAVIGKKPLQEGLNIICAHMDSPRLDLKQNPLYEDTGLAYLKTHYYGGLKKFHWLNIPLAIHGKVVKLSGESVEFRLGENENDPVFVIPDLLPHLSKKLSEKTVKEAFVAENMNLVMGHIPVDEEEKEAVKANLLKILNDQYGIDEKDFNSAEIEIVPAFRPREAGLDKSFIAGYGQDDRICSYLAFRSILETETPERTGLVLLIDKEEIGSEGNSSIQSKFFELFLGDLMEKTDSGTSEKSLKKTLYNSQAISADVDVAFDPNYKEVFDIRNTGKIGNGIVLVKYTGHGGKYGANDSNAEYVARLRKLFTENNVLFQFGSLGKIDEGGGGTISKFLAAYGMEIIDAGTPILGMHSPYELSSKSDLFQSRRAFTVFFSKM